MGARTPSSSNPASDVAVGFSSVSLPDNGLEAVHTDKAPAPTGHYSQAITVTSKCLLYVSGTLGLVPETGKFISDDDVLEQTEQALKNIGEILKAGGATFSSVFEITTMLVDPEDRR